MEKELRFRYSWKNYIGHLIILLVIIILFGLMAMEALVVVILVGVLAALVSLFLIWLNRLSNLYVVTKERTSWQKGILSRETIEIENKNIRTINVRQGVIQRLLKIGQVMIATAGTTEFEITMKGIDNPHKVKSSIQQKPTE